MTEKRKEWFAEWFDSPFYHILYQHRNDAEAAKFLNNLIGFLQVEKGAAMADIACGSGRHSRYLNQKGFRVCGVDLSPNSINEANKLPALDLEYKVGDMRHLPLNQSFDYVFNLFTSFGYFNSLDENKQVINEFHRILYPKGKLIIDFLNATKIKQKLINQPIEEVIFRDEICFKTKKFIQEGKIKKHIQFLNFEFTESVQAIELNDFENLLNNNGFKITNSFGDYELSNFDAQISERLIIIAERL